MTRLQCRRAREVGFKEKYRGRVYMLAFTGTRTYATYNIQITVTIQQPK